MPQHKLWVKACHWTVTLSFLFLLISGYEMLMVNPRFYWGEVGNPLMPVFLELPVSPNSNIKWEGHTPFSENNESIVSANRMDEGMFNQNGWGRSLHFLAAWFLLAAGLIYVLAGLIGGHIKNHVVPLKKEISIDLLKRDLINHLKMKIPKATAGPSYGLLQKIAYASMIIIVFPVTVASGFTMSPAITAAYPFLLTIFGGYQSARTIHFLAAVILVLFLLAHLVMIIKSGFGKHMRYMTIGK